MEWGGAATDSGPFVLGIVGDGIDPGALQQLSGKPVGDSRLEVRAARAPRELRACHMLYVSGAESGLVDSVLIAVSDAAVLTVSDIKGFAGRGGIIEFVRRRNKLRFIINPDSARQANLKLSSQLLKIAELIE